MNTAGTKIAALSIVAASLLQTGCTPLSLAPPSPEKPTLLVLPAEVVLDAQNRHYAFSFAYEIVKVDNSIPPYQAVFRLPVKERMVIVDSLPAGNYRVPRLLTIPLGSGTKTYDIQGMPANFEFRLEPGKVTIIPQSLYIRTFNATPGRGLSTTYQTRILPANSQQKIDLLEKLEALPGFSAWEVLDANVSRARSAGQQEPFFAGEQFGGAWSGFWRPVTAATITCNQGKLSFAVEGSQLAGEGVDVAGGRYRITASLIDDGLIRGRLSRDGASLANVSGRLYDDGSILGSFDYGADCQAEWKARKN